VFVLLTMLRTFRRSSLAKQATVLLVDGTRGDASGKFFAAVHQASSTKNKTTTRVAFDCEGVNLSRIGTVDLVSLSFEHPMDGNDKGAVFLVDATTQQKDGHHKERIHALKTLLESKQARKIIHDCRTDCDALYHLHGIRVVNVHDTSCFHAAETGKERASLNTVLSYHGLSRNVVRDKSVYRTNPFFFGTNDP